MGTAAKTSLVIASPVVESRRRWGQKLQEAFTICEVAERRALEQVTAALTEPPVQAHALREASGGRSHV